MTICIFTRHLSSRWRSSIGSSSPASLESPLRELIIILPKMNWIVVSAVQSGLAYYAVSTNKTILNQSDEEPNSKPIVFLQSCQLPRLHLLGVPEPGIINQYQRQRQIVKVKRTDDDHHYHPHKNWPGLKVGEEPGHLSLWVVFPLVRRKLLEF